MRTRHRLLAASVLTVALAASYQPMASAATGHQPLTAAGLVAALRGEGIAVPNPIDTTTQECPVVGCRQEVVTDTIRVTSFSGVNQARWYAASRGLPSFGNIVVEFAPPLSADQRAGYLREISQLLP